MSAIGAGVAINLANVTNEAVVESGAFVVSNGLTADASMTDVSGDTTSRFGAESTSGAGGGSIGVAGSVSINIVNVNTSAAIRTTGSVNAGGGDVSLTAASTSVSTVKALGGTIGGSSFGLGISFALSIVNDTTFAGIEDTGLLTNAHDLVLGANGQHAMTTLSQTGAAGPIAIVPSIAISISNVTSRANIGTGGLLTVTGKVDATARMTASAVTSAAGAATGGSTAAIGVSLALTLATHTVESTTHRDINAGTSVSFQALGGSASEANAAASAAGAPGEDSPDHSSGDTVDGQVAGQRSYADSTAGPGHDSGGAGSTPSSTTSSGGVSVAAAVGINISNSSSRAYVPTGIHITAGGAMTLKTSANSDAKAKGDGSAVLSGGSGVTVGAGVAVNLANVTNEAVVQNGAVVNSNGFTADASETNVSGDTTSTFAAETTAGASGGQVGVAGSVAIDLVTINTTGGIRSGGIVNAGTGDVFIGAASNSSTTTNALMANTGAGGASVGVGASFALAIVNDTTFAGLENSATLTGGHDLTMRADGRHAMTTQAKMGASSPKVAVAPGVAVVISNVKSSADIGTGTPLILTGSFDAQAKMTASAITSAEGDTHGGTASIGVGFALTLATHTVESTTLRNITATGSVGFQALGSSASEANAKASAAGAPGEDSPDHTSGDAPDAQAGHERSFADSRAGAGHDSGGAGSTPSSDTSSGSVSVAAAVGITISNSSSRAIIPTGITITAGGAVTLKTSANSDAKSKGDGSAVSTGGSGVSVGAGVAVTLANVTNEAVVQNGAIVNANGFTADASETNVSGDTTSTFGAETTAGASGGQVGIAGSVAISLITVNTTGGIRSGGIVNAGTGDVSHRRRVEQLDDDERADGEHRRGRLQRRRRRLVRAGDRERHDLRGAREQRDPDGRARPDDAGERRARDDDAGEDGRLVAEGRRRAGHRGRDLEREELGGHRHRHPAQPDRKPRRAGQAHRIGDHERARATRTAAPRRSASPLR